MTNPRIIGECSGSQPGPLLIVLAQIHGNEPAGYLALQHVFKAIEAEFHAKPHFDFRGRIVGIHGNMAAAAKGVRYIQQDLNRMWTANNVARIMSLPKELLDVDEELQLREILETIHEYIATYLPKKIVVLDLHTTTAHGGIFIIPSKDEKARQLAYKVQAPILHGFLDDIQGTVLHYFTRKNFPKLDITSICFEAGQHDSRDSIEHAVSAIIQCFEAIHGFYSEDIEMKHEMLFAQDSVGLPKEAQLIYSHRIKSGDNFKMRSDKIYRNFDMVYKGELLATDRHGEIRALCDGLILMPLYQKQGSDGFFIIKDINQNAPKLQRRIPRTTLNA